MAVLGRYSVISSWISRPIAKLDIANTKCLPCISRNLGAIARLTKSKYTADNNHGQTQLSAVSVHLHVSKSSISLKTSPSFCSRQVPHLHLQVYLCHYGWPAADIWQALARSHRNPHSDTTYSYS